MRASRSTLNKTLAMSKNANKVPFSKLPLPPSSHLLTHNLTPDPRTPDPVTFFSDVLARTPSIQRRARLLSPEAHFSYVNPMPLEFPYEIAPPDPPEVITNKAEYIEQWLSDHEAKIPAEASSALSGNFHLHKYISKSRNYRRELIALSETCVNDCLPLLDCGDAIDTLKPTFVPSKLDIEKVSSSAEAQNACQELVDILGGHVSLMSPDGSDQLGGKGCAPWSLRYSGHQFGDWAGQLGDGRAISILVTPHPSDPDTTYEVQLKGAGRTPFSRSADGLAVLRSSIREYLCSEAMHALGIPTTRSLALVYLPELPVIRERVEKACVTTRVAETFIRIGNFEALSPPSRAMFFFGGGQQHADYEALRILGEWTVRRILKLGNVDLDAGDAWGKELVFEVARRNAKMVAAWQAYGFMHGVINTDNVSIAGLTIDYGPYAFMDVFDPHHICNHSDQEGRYAYNRQPNMIGYACRALLNALAPLIGAEIAQGNKAVQKGWANNVNDETISEWRTAGIEEVGSTMNQIIESTYTIEYGMTLRRRLALRRVEPSDQRTIFQPLLDMMENQRLDFHGTFRKLAFFQPRMLHGEDNSGTTTLEAFIAELLRGAPEWERLDTGKATEEWLAWLDAYAARIESEKTGGGWAGEDFDEARGRAAIAANPRFVLRQWLLEEVIKKVEADPTTGRHILAKVMQMACSPFKPWGREGDASDNELSEEEREERRYCGLGDRRMLGFQCSCSS
ncbi:hypothetical protein BKA82DRAFT_375752 [Pisolithus tinctorius]|uniref:Selenoprotein O n=1 Tax=Pisolithus tinctorius Marx 270 TaxID=870435 RepID=A0A0C3PII0_PISTI|nr:hypothetical protein BKA82DRAFT_375752 [Pisolithus tinctorius]KIO07909.1 hypothetical protein M404DRAFT_375752 [Pisolithus tinctorius Marx 270]